MKIHSVLMGAVALFFASIASPAFAAINVLWYSYADPASEYKNFYRALVTTGSPQSTGQTWNLTFWSPADPPPNFANFNVLVIHSGEAFRTGAPGQPNVTPDYSGILANKLAIEAARGNRTLLSGSDADFHAVRGDSGVCVQGAHCFDGALGYVINAVNWAGGGSKLGVVSFIDGNFPGSFWWDKPESFLGDELRGYVSHSTENAADIDPVQATYPMNQGLTSLGLSDWNVSFHGAFLKTIPGYTATVNSPSNPTYALTIVSTNEVGERVVEYRNTADFPGSPGGHFFYSADREEQAGVDAGLVGAWTRTGRSFLIGGTTPICRFYGSMSPGPNSHFFTADADECNGLKAAQIIPTPTTVQQWNYEGIGFATTPATIGAGGVRSCPGNLQPIYRAYNNAYTTGGVKNPWDSNHRLSPQAADIAEVVAVGWRDEGVVFCAPVQ